MMYPCNDCLENRWSFECLEGIVYATCEICGNEVEFEARHSRPKKDFKVGESCRKCGAKIILREPRKINTKSKYRYSAYYYCPKCKTMYMSEKFKIINKSRI